ncbi:MAG: CRISPR-associated helicase Cas3' [Clostridia bacterium]|nr:CRISPR-associated helicase Cas3' [Clostridia bacterium]
MNYYAHTREDGEKQLLKDHLQQTAKLAGDFALPEFRHCAQLAGLLHDLGKYQPSFQKKLEGKTIKIEHSACGAVEINKLLRGVFGVAFAYAVAGHHAGLPDYGADQDDPDEGSLCAKLHPRRYRENYSAYQSEVTLPLNEAAGELASFFQSISNAEVYPDCYEFLVRYLYSCLTDADFLDTERFCRGERPHLPNADFEKCREQLNEKFASFQAKTALQRARSSLQEQAYRRIEKDAPFYLLNMPTGSGKTLCSMKLALELLRREKKKRIIYVIPYTSIIEQTAEVFETLFPELTILQHHSDYILEEAERELQAAVENWDAPVIITTNVQFFESIYDNHSSRLRKLHHMADSVIVFDEIHTLPIGYFIPCFQAIEQLTTYYRAKAIFLTATMPDFPALVERYLGRHVEMVDLIPDRVDCSAFEKCNYEWLEGDVLDDLDPSKNTLIIFNRKKTAERYYRNYAGKKYYLSTYLTPTDRSEKIREIREILASSEEKIVVFSTSLIEAGVDVDFESVYRELSGIDNILQAGGRCNREGKRPKEESVVKIFRTEDKAIGEMAVKANVAKGLIADYGVQSISSLECVKAYFDEMYDFIIQKPKKSVTANSFYRIDFASKAKAFQLIESTTVSVVIPCEEIAEELEKLRHTGFADRRKLRRYAACVNYYELNDLLAAGVVRNEHDVFILEVSDYYSEETGLNVDHEADFLTF